MMFFPGGLFFTLPYFIVGLVSESDPFFSRNYHVAFGGTDGGGPIEDSIDKHGRKFVYKA